MYKIIGSDQKIYGPVTAELVRQWLAEGRLSPATLVQAEGSAEWKALSAFPEFAPPPPPPGAAAPAPQAVLPPQPPRAVAMMPESNSAATWGFIFGLLSIIPCCCCGFVFAIAGVILSSVGLTRANRLPQEEGKTLAIVGLILSILGLASGAISTLLLGILRHGPGQFNYHWNW